MKPALKYFLLISSFSCIQLTAQDKTTDSLKLALKNTTNDTTKCFLLTRITDRLDPKEK